MLGRDGTLADIQKTSPAAGRVFAKTGKDSAKPWKGMIAVGSRAGAPSVDLALLIARGQLLLRLGGIVVRGRLQPGAGLDALPRHPPLADDIDLLGGPLMPLEGGTSMIRTAARVPADRSHDVLDVALGAFGDDTVIITANVDSLGDPLAKTIDGCDGGSTKRWPASSALNSGETVGCLF